MPDALQVGNGKVKGMVRTGPQGQASVGAQGSVGDMTWVNSGQVGIQQDHFADDINTDLLPVTLPANTTWLPPIPGKYQVNGSDFKYSLGSGAWILPNLDGSLNVSGNVVLYVTSSIKIGAGMQIHIAPGASLSIYMGGASASIGGRYTQWVALGLMLGGVAVFFGGLIGATYALGLGNPEAERAEDL